MGPRRRPLSVALALGAALACNAPGDGAARAAGLNGVAIDPPLPRGSFMLTDAAGERFEFAERTAGQLTLVFFGYTNCPDICPVHLSNLGQVLERFPHEVRSRIRVVFVTTDPDRDTPERIRDWLDAMGSGFIGLHGPIEEVNRIQAMYGLPPAAPARERDGNYAVGHAAQVLAITPDDSVRFAYPFGTRQADWLHDLPVLLTYGRR